MKRLRYAFLRLRGGWRLAWGFCPKCNSDAPAKDTCTVCRWTYVLYPVVFPPPPPLRKVWWQTFLRGIKEDHNG